MINTYARPVRELRNNYNEIINLANEGNQVIITHNGKEAAVVIGKAFRIRSINQSGLQKHCLRSTFPFSLNGTPSASKYALCSGQPGTVRPA